MYRLLPIIAGLVTEDIGTTLRRKRRNAILYAFAAVFAASAWIALIAAGAVWLATLYGAVAGPLIVAGALFAIAAGLVLAVAIFKAIERREARRAPSIGPAAGLAAAAILPSLLRQRPLGTLVAVAGLAAVATAAMARSETED